MKNKIILVVIGITVIGLLAWLSPIIISEVKIASMTPEEREKMELISNKLTDCLFSADDKFRDEWNLECKSLKLHNECDLDANKMNSLLENYNNEAEVCEKIYK